MKLISVIRNLFIKQTPPPPLGRWNIEKCNIKINNKIDASNEDHCGPCGEYIINKNPENLLQDKNKLNNMNLNILIIDSKKY